MSDSNYTLIRSLLGQPIPAIIDALTPKTMSEAMRWAQHLLSFDDALDPQVCGLARIITKRGMREHGLRLTEDGRIVGDHSQKPQSKRSFLIKVAGETLKVEYTHRYFLHNDRDAFYFVRPDYVHPTEDTYRLPDKPHVLSSTGFLNQFAPHDAVAACGGPEAYARLFAEAVIRGEETAFTQTFEGKRPEPKTRKRRAREVVGEHTGRIAEVISPDEPTEPSLF